VGSSDYYRFQAARAEGAALRAKWTHHRDAWLRLADQWDALAGDVDRRHGRLNQLLPHVPIDATPF